MSLNYGYTGEPTDENNLVYLRARYYNRNTGTFLSLDPYEGDPTRPMSLNRYAYAEGNPVNLVDHTGLCAMPSSQDGALCRNIVQDVRTQYNVNVLWQEDNLSEVLQDMCVEASEQFPQNKLIWTATEAMAIQNAFRIFDQAYQNIDGFASAYSEWQNKTIDLKIIKQEALGELTDASGEAIAVVGAASQGVRTLALSKDGWSEGLSKDLERNIQQKSWFVLHEFGHILINDLDSTEENLIDLLSRTVYYNDESRGRGHFPTEYANSGGLDEFVTESLTGALWNRGYTAIPGYDASAGRLTGWLDLETHRNNLQRLEILNPDGTTSNASIVNVDLNLFGDRQTLGEWILRQLIPESD